ncbi:threonine/serine exporter family protein [Pseudoxanthobacter sp.]|uniref:threonine/serine exporter family protein n=1 Tax=Pseudoxanthobacter sp. TaxID=1925742 RepID=UPI002FE2771F
MAPLPSAAGDEAVALLRDCARLLFCNGQTSERTVRSVESLAGFLGVTVSVAPRWGAVTLRFSGPGQPVAPEIVPAVPAGVEMHKVTETLRVMQAVRAGRLAPGAARERLAAAGRLPPVPVLRFAALAGAGAAALAVIFGAADPLTLLLVFASAFAGACLRRGLARLFPNPLSQPLGAAFLAGLVAVAAAHLMPKAAVFVIALCPCMVLVPGPHLLNGAIDLARMRLPLAIERLCYAGLLVLLITVGLIAGLLLGGQSLPLSGSGNSVALAVDVAAAGLAVAAYGTFFSMPWRMLPVPMAVGMAAHALHWAVLALGGGDALSALVACLFVGAVVTPLSNRLHMPFAAFAFASVVSLIPGSFVFRMADALIGLSGAGDAARPQLLTAALMDGTTAVAIMIAMAFGLILPKMLIESLRPPAAF